MHENEMAGDLQSQADVWYLKEILFDDGGPTPRSVKIITQNFNGPCSFIAICNILILRGQIEILPRDRTSVSYEFLSQLVGEYLLINCPDVDISAALSILPTTTKGLDLNPIFTSSTSFRPAGEGGELSLFSQAGIELVHGWLVDPNSPEADAVSSAGDYDSAVNLLADADHLTRGQLLGNAAESKFEIQNGAGSSSSSNAVRHFPSYSNKERDQIEQALKVRTFLDNTQSQLTYYGLFHLASTLQPGALVALFRNSHLSVLYKAPVKESITSEEPGPESPIGNILPPESFSPTHDSTPHAETPSPSQPEPDQAQSSEFSHSTLYALVTDNVFLQEPSVVWERLEDISGSNSTFVDAAFRKASPAGGDWAGYTAEAALAAFEQEAGISGGTVDPADQALARQLQAEEDQRAQEYYARREQDRLEKARQSQQMQGGSRSEGRAEPKASWQKIKKKGDKCVIM